MAQQFFKGEKVAIYAEGELASTGEIGEPPLIGTIERYEGPLERGEQTPHGTQRTSEDMLHEESFRHGRHLINDDFGVTRWGFYDNGKLAEFRDDFHQVWRDGTYRMERPDKDQFGGNFPEALSHHLDRVRYLGQSVTGETEQAAILSTLRDLINYLLKE